MSSQVGYQGLMHFMRTKKAVRHAADLLAAQPDAPPVGEITAALRQFAAHTPHTSGAQLRTYFLALISMTIQQRGQSIDPLIIYMLEQKMSLPAGRGA